MRPLSLVYSFFRLVVLIYVVLAFGSMFTFAQTIGPKTAAEQARSVALAPSNNTEFVFTALPKFAKPGQPRTIFLQLFGPFCPGLDVSLDTSVVDSQDLLVMRSKRAGGIICPSVPHSPVHYRFAFEFVPTRPGTITIRNELTLTDISIETVSTPVASKFDVNGMWFDPATSGSGISIHHGRGKTDAAFGTWFLFNNNLGRPLWYSLQSVTWTQDGSVLEGLLYAVAGTCADSSLNGCPGVGSVRTPSPFYSYPYWEIPSIARITFQSGSRARAEVLTQGGAVLFTSELSKLQF